MIEESAQIISVDRDRVWVSVNRQSACASCSASKGCGQKKIIDWLPAKQIEVEISNPQSLVVRPGQIAWVGLKDGALVRASLLVYILPLLTMISFALVANFLEISEPFQIFGTMLGLTIGFVATRVIAIRELALGTFVPQLISVE